MASQEPGLTTKTKQILEQSDQDRARLLDAVDGLAPEQTQFRPTQDSWSVGDVLHHLALAHEATAKLMSVFLRRAREEDIGSDPTPDESVLHSIDDVVSAADQTKASAPERVTPKSELAPAESVTRLRESRNRLGGTVAELSAFDLRQLTFPHPFFGELDACQWLLTVGWHERRHTAQIERIKASPDFPRA